MGYHKTLHDAIKALMTTALTVSEALVAPIIDSLNEAEAQAERLAVFTVLVRDRIDLELSPVIGGGIQEETWTWKIYVTGGGGGARSYDKSTHVDTLLELLRTGLAQKKPVTPDCGPMQLISEEYLDYHGTAVTYVQTWTHGRASQ